MRNGKGPRRQKAPKKRAILHAIKTTRGGNDFPFFHVPNYIKSYRPTFLVFLIIQTFKAIVIYDLKMTGMYGYSFPFSFNNFFVPSISLFLLKNTFSIILNF